MRHPSTPRLSAARVDGRPLPLVVAVLVPIATDEVDRHSYSPQANLSGKARPPGSCLRDCVRGCSRSPLTGLARKDRAPVGSRGARRSGFGCKTGKSTWRGERRESTSSASTAHFDGCSSARIDLSPTPLLRLRKGFSALNFTNRDELMFRVQPGTRTGARAE